MPVQRLLLLLTLGLLPPPAPALEPKDLAADSDRAPLTWNRIGRVLDAYAKRLRTRLDEANAGAPGAERQQP
jgi:hypothetical protein